MKNVRKSLLFDSFHLESWFPLSPPPLPDLLIGSKRNEQASVTRTFTYTHGRRWLHSALPSLSLSRWVHVRLHERILNGPRGPWSVPVRYSQAITTIGYTPIKPGASRDLLAMHRVQVS